MVRYYSGRGRRFEAHKGPFLNYNNSQAESASWRNSMQIDDNEKLKNGNAEPYVRDKNEGKCAPGGKGKTPMTMTMTLSRRLS